MKDVTRQVHYINNTIQPIRVMYLQMSAEAFKGFLKGNIMKYLMREDKKNKAEDVAKALVYMQWLDEYVRTGNITVPGEEE